MSEMVEVTIDSIRVHLMAPQRVIVLKQVNAERFLTVWVGPYEAEAITIALQEVEVARPLTHDLIKNIFQAFHARILRVEIVSLRDDVFYGNIVVETSEGEKHIDSRPSDAIAIAVRAHAPILVHRSVMDQAAIVPEANMPTPPPPPPARAESPSSRAESENSDRLSVFKDFLDKLDSDNPDRDKNDKPAS